MTQNEEDYNSKMIQLENYKIYLSATVEKRDALQMQIKVIQIQCDTKPEF